MPYLHGIGRKKVIARANCHLEVENDIIWYCVKNGLPGPDDGEPKESYLKKILDLVQMLEAKIKTLEDNAK